MQKITASIALAILTKVVSAVGKDHVYVNNDGIKAGGIIGAECTYVHDGDTPGCIVGHAMVRLGVSVGELKPLNTAGALSLLWELEEKGVLKTTSMARNVFMEAQMAQDRGATWGEALKEAKDSFVESCVYRGMEDLKGV